jgi:hypothetical protein
MTLQTFSSGRFVDYNESAKNSYEQKLLRARKKPAPDMEIWTRTQQTITCDA